MRILVTGGAGYIGSRLIPLLVAAGHSTLCVDPRGHELPSLLDPQLFEHGRLDVAACSVLDIPTIASLARECDAAIHLAAIVGAPSCDAAPEAAWRVNVDGTRCLIDALPTGMPLALASTCSVYGQVGASLCTEEVAARPLSLYAETKRQAEQLVRNRRGVVLRFVTLYGTAPRFRWDLLLHTFLRMAVEGERLELFEPNAYRPFIHVDDAARALLFAVERHASLSGQVFNVGSAEPTLTKREIAERIARIVPFEVSVDVRRSDPDQRDYKVSSRKIERHGFASTIRLHDVLPRMLDEVRAKLAQPELSAA